MISLITTCRGRLNHLKRSLPTFVNVADEVVVVDYNCPEGTGDYVAKHFPTVTVVREPTAQNFHLARARNIGARASSGDILLFCDADVLLSEAALPAVRLIDFGKSYGVFRSPNDLRGTCALGRPHFERIAGYDELLVGYSGEDLDLYMRLRNIGLMPHYLDPKIVMELITHDDSTRAGVSDGASLERQFLRGQAYQMAKEIILRCTLRDNIDEKLRASLMHRVERGLNDIDAGDGAMRLTMNFPDFYSRGLLSEYQFSYSVELKVSRK